MKCELQVIRETWRVRTDFERIAGCFRYVNDQTTDRAGFLVHKILFLVLNSRIYCGRSPHGERGLKLNVENSQTVDSGRSPPGERGLKLICNLYALSGFSRSPHGERGLKYRR